MALLQRSNLPGIRAHAWANRILEIKIEGTTLYTFHGVPEGEYQRFRNTNDPQKFLAYLKSTYRYETADNVMG